MRPGVPAPPHQGASGAQAQKFGSLAGREKPPQFLFGQLIFLGCSIVADRRSTSQLSTCTFWSSFRAARTTGSCFFHGDGFIGAISSPSSGSAAAATTTTATIVNSSGSFRSNRINAYRWFTTTTSASSIGTNAKSRSTTEYGTATCLFDAAATTPVPFDSEWSHVNKKKTKKKDEEEEVYIYPQKNITKNKQEFGSV